MEGFSECEYNKEITLGLKIRFQSSLPTAALKEDQKKKKTLIFFKVEFKQFMSWIIQVACLHCCRGWVG